MVGGRVIETIDTGEKVWINCRERGTRCRSSVCKAHTCAIYVERTPESRAVSVGDGIWWQADSAFWTPKGRAFEDKKLARVGFSGVRRPSLATLTE